MTDIDDLFRTSVRFEEQESDPDDELDGASGTSDAETADGLIDLGALVTSWNEEHGRPEATESESEPLPVARRNRLAQARHRVAERIGSHPEHPVAPPIPTVDADGSATDELADGEAEPAAPEADDDELLNRQSRRDRRRAQKEIDRLRRAYEKNPPDLEGLPEVEGVTLIGPEPGRSAESVVSDPAGPAVTGDRPSPPDPTTTVDPTEGEVAAPLTRRDRRRAWKEADRRRTDEAKGRVRFPILTRSVAIWLLVFLLAGLAFGASGAFWWSHFNSEVDALRAETVTFADQVQNASTAIETQREDAMIEIDDALDVFTRIAGAPEAVAGAGDYADSVWFVETLDEEGVAAVGSAFVVANTEDQSLLLTSLDVVKAATANPAPPVTVRGRDQSIEAELWNWDPELDLALLVVDVPDLPAVEWATDEDAAKALGSGVVVIGGLGGAGASAVPGLVIDQSVAGLQHTVPVGAAYRGGPIINGSGRALGIASTAFDPLGFDAGEVRFAVPMAKACDTVLVCGAGAAPTPGESGGDPITDDEPTEAGDGPPADPASSD